MTPKFMLPFVLLAFAHCNAFAQSATRTSAFEYDAVTGLLTKEIIEPDIPALCLATEYQYDNYGNKVRSETKSCSAPGAGRISQTSYAPTAANPVPGQFPTSSTNAMGHVETKEFDARFGAVTKLTGPNLLSTTWEYDSLGRMKKETRADATISETTYTLCVTCPPNGKYFSTHTGSGMPAKNVYFDLLNREIRSEVQGFDGTWVRKDTEYNPIGTVLRVSRPYLASGSPVWTTFTTYDELGRLVVQTEANNAVTTTNYNGLTVIVTNALNQTETRVKNSQGQLIQVTRQ